jgi:sulfoxide reductase catalytic subunit YedY
MLIKKQTGMEIPSSEITPHHLYLSRRTFMQTATAVAAGALLAACRPDPPTAAEPVVAESTTAGDAPANTAPTGLDTISASTDELGDPLNSYQDITTFNNYYEFTQNKESVYRLAADFPTSPWKVEVKGLVNNPGVYDIDDLRSQFDQEERIYRLRCVEGWSMVIPWVGFPLAKLLQKVEPTSKATHVLFHTVLDPDNMPGQRSPWFEWPYTEGLRLDEAMNNLALMATGMYGTDLLPQNGAPLRLAVPWKYGFKSVKSIVNIELVDYQPTSLWMSAAPNEYGFYANVNPNVPHPRWSQATERRIGELGRRETLLFNGYEEQVAHLYDGEDLDENF